MESIEEKFQNFLVSENLKLTSERLEILSEVFSTNIHFEADDLVHRMNQQSRRISRATVYRTLDLLVKSGLVRKYTFADKPARYERIYGRQHHEHMICTYCGRVIEFTNDEIERLQGEVCREYGFTPEHHTLQIYGKCKDCREGRPRKGDRENELSF